MKGSNSHEFETARIKDSLVLIFEEMIKIKMVKNISNGFNKKQLGILVGVVVVVGLIAGIIGSGIGNSITANVISDSQYGAGKYNAGALLLGDKSTNTAWQVTHRGDAAGSEEAGDLAVYYKDATGKWVENLLLDKNGYLTVRDSVTAGRFFGENGEKLPTSKDVLNILGSCEVEGISPHGITCSEYCSKYNEVALGSFMWFQYYYQENKSRLYSFMIDWIGPDQLVLDSQVNSTLSQLTGYKSGALIDKFDIGCKCCSLTVYQPCPSEKPYRCADGSCVGSVSLCGPAYQKSSTKKFPF